jgi:aryl-alcohol dehydrogenase-like predicted oxidoreductase
MKSRVLGRTGFTVSEIGHGLWGMGSWSGSSDDQSKQSLELSFKLGCSFYDTAWVYGDGRSDRLLGSLIQDVGSGHLISASKVPPANMVFPASKSDPFEKVYPRDYVIQISEKIRQALKVDTIPLLQFHVWDDHWIESPTFSSIVSELKTKSIVNAIGISLNRWEPWNGIRAVESGLIDSVQVIYNIFDQAPEDKLFPACRKHNVGIIARVPLDEGSLGGNMTLNTKFPDTDWRARYFGSENLPETIKRVDALKAVLPAGMSLPEMALRFILSNPDLSTVIVGMRKPEHVRANLTYSDLGALPPELIAQLRKHRWDRQVTSWAN